LEIRAMQSRSCALAITLCVALPGVSHAAQFSYSGEDVVQYVLRESSAGTSLERARITQMQTPHGSLGMGIAQLVQGAVSRCAAIESIDVAPVASVDSIGETSTHIQGLGVYASISDSSARGSGMIAGKSFLAPFYSLKVTVKAGGNEKSSTVFDFSRSLVESRELSKAEVLALPPAAVQESVLKFAGPKLQATILELAKPACPSS
jgi:hypothetical protein